ncbi:Glycosyltransferase sugar-binding region containing DXD motif protein [Vibrio aerogenes CECT 7868]|uniref:Glycosyltransferase sugar-binding region containing DXD motif protein n=1 Tax=Vibrio aerogenes CECT 7868 TaxID=1216006 RepID=A0A1M5ZCW9_9VIBR|nr:glycosyltransferase [Vibrio aerogenes]SHI22077.1 Glycosyltransferase sugar-binding region containing DXD motif protein [Vibrio aerogenes CECT 7868]
MSDFFKIVLNRGIRLVGNLIKLLSYFFHFVFPKARFTIPEYSKAKIKKNKEQQITKLIWQTNYSNRCTLPVYINYLFNRLMSLDYDYRYVSTEEREAFMRDNAAPEVFQAYMKLNDGAAQADLWRVTTLYLHGGIYMDIDATLVWPLNKTLQGSNDSLFIKYKNNTEFTNFFLATAPDNPVYKSIIEKVVDNINHFDSMENQSAFAVTGPLVVNEVLKDQEVLYKSRDHVCIQGTFTNEYFQYMDKPKGKWNHKKPGELLKK